ncbi:MAG: CapA family protein [Labilithrix sp.]|nr:CapA family protein [Labilithrix sp.]
MSPLTLLRLVTVACLSVFTVTAVGCSSDASVGEEEDEDEEGVGATEDPLSVPAATGPLQFRDACRAGTKITIAAVGDVLLHAGLQRQAYAAENGHHTLWRDVEPMLAKADLTYGNLEGPCAEGVTTSGQARDPGKVFDGSVYSSYPQFNYHPSLIGDLKSSGFDVVSTANNHALDRRALGADRTITNLKAAGMPFTGTRPSDDQSAPWYTITESRGVKVAWVACTFSTNGIPDPKKQVLMCYENRETVLSTIRGLAARTGEVDAVIVTPHWGAEYTHTPSAQEKRLAKDMLDAGALAVFGGHPHVVQPWEKHVTPDGREAFVIYSLGNFVSGQNGLAKRSSLILYVGLTKGSDGKVSINGVRHVPIQMHPSPWTAKHATGESLALTTRILGQWNRLGADEPLVTNPECSR